MTFFVKKFIQNNSNFIDESNWYALCREWYEAADRDWEYEDTWFKEFCDIMSQSDIDFLEPSHDDRKRIVELNLIPLFDNFVASSTRTILKETIRFALVSTLGLNNSDIDNIMEKIAAGFNLHSDFEHYEKLG